MKKLITILYCLLWGALSGLNAQSPTQLVTAIQYFFDTDPGFGIPGNGAVLPITPTANYQQTLQVIVPTDLGGGIHFLYVRVMDEFGRWSIAEKTMLHVEAVHRSKQITAYQYYFDTDPGQGQAGNGAVVSVSPNATYQQSVPIQVPDLGGGIHYLYVRAQDEYGRWGLAERTLLMIESIHATQQLQAYQYYFDEDPGVGIAGNGAIVPITPTDSFHQNVTLSVPSDLSSGIHFLYVRFQDTSGRWGLADRKMLLVQPGTDTMKITAYQYYFDEDPGVGMPGNGAIVPVTPTTDLNQVISITIPTTLSSGVHNLFIRARDQYGRWSITDKKVLVTGGGFMDVVNQMEYYFDNDPGVGNANPLPVSADSVLNFTTGIQVPCLSSGTHYLYVRAKGDRGVWSLIARDTITITSGVPTAVVYPQGNVSVCPTDSLMLHASPIAGVNYEWLLNGTPIPGQTDTFLYVNAAGSYSLRSTCGSSFTTSNVVTVSVQTVNTYYQDSDGDGYGNPNDSLQSCTQPSGYVFSNTDCNDANSQVHPGATETCNGVDDDCDGLIDENVQTVWYADADGDTYGNLNDTLMSCSQPPGYVALSGDCNDANTQVHPAATEVCNGIDDDCDGQTDEGLLNTYYADSDGDGYGNAASSVQACSAPSGYVIDNTDCDDNVAGIHAPLTYFVDADQDGFGSSTSVLLCSLNAPIGYSTNSMDCNDGDFMIKPTGLEICNGIDDDCDGLTDMADPSLTGAPLWYADADGDSFGDPVVSQTSCAPIPGYVSNNQDCDDSDSLEFPGQIWYIDQDGDGYGAGVTQVSCLRPLNGYHAFELTAIGSDCNDNDATIHPAAQFFTFSGGPVYGTQVINSVNGDSYTNFQFEVVYHDLNGALPPATFPRILLDYEGNAVYTNPNDRIVVLTEDDVNDTNTADGKKYVGSINSLPVGINWKTVVQTNVGLCASYFGPFDYPDVLVQPDIEIFANDISFSAPNPPVASPLTVSATIHNVSDYDAQNFVVHLVNQYDTTVVYPDITVGFLGAHSSTTVNWTITTPAIPAWCPMQVSIDYTGVIAESNELDNTAIRPFINGPYNLPGGIIATGDVSPSVAYAVYGFNTLYGTAHYTGTAVPLPDSSVAGATVSFTIVETGASYSTYTNSSGHYALSFPRPLIPGTYHIQGSVTDYTLTGNFTAQFEVILPPVPPCLPDLQMQMQFSAANILVGNSTTGFIEIKNVGCATSPATDISVAQTGGSPSLPATISVPSLAPNATFTYPVTLSFNIFGQYSLCAQVDGANLIQESYEMNNAQCAQFNVYANFVDIVPGGGPSGTSYDCGVNGVSFRVYNTGTLSSGPFDVEVEVYHNAVYQTTLTHSITNILSAFSQYNYTDFSVPFTPSGTGNYTFVLKCDAPLNQVSESLESNNQATYGLNLIPCLPNFAANGCETFDVESDSGDYSSGDSLTIKGLISNTGNLAYTGNLEVTFALSGGASFTQSYAVSLLPNASVQVTKRILMPALANQELTMFIDPNDQIAEMTNGDNTVSNFMCWDFQPVPLCGINFWQLPHLINQSVYPSIGITNSRLFDADSVKVKFEVSGPGIPGTINLGYGTLTNMEQTCGCPPGVSAPVNFVFPQIGTYTFTMTVDGNQVFDECNENNNVFSVQVTASNLPDMRILSQYINPSMLNPQPGQGITMDVTYENIGAGNVNDQMRLNVLVDNQPFATVNPVAGLVSGDNTTVSIPGTFSSLIPGVHIIRAIIDADQVVTESNEMNNEATRAFVVGESANLYFQQLTASNLTPSVNDNLTIQYRVGNNGDLACDADVQFFYVDNNLDTVFIGDTHISLNPNDSINLTQTWIVADHKTTLVARIVNSSILEATYVDNENYLTLGAMQVNLISTVGCTGGNNGTLSANILGGDAPYTLTWNNGYIGPVLTAGAGTYTVTVSDNGGQTISATGSITEALIQTQLQDTACDAYVLPWNVVPVLSSGSYQHTYTTALGCDSLVTLDVVILNSTTDTTTVSACDQYIWNLNAATYTQSGTYTTTSTNAAGCTHTSVLVLSLGTSSNVTLTETSCGDYTWLLNGQTYTQSGTYSYTDSGAGCPVNYTLLLTINNSSNTTQQITQCGPYTWAVNGQTYTQSGIYSDTTYSGGGCMVIQNLNLTISASNTYTVTQTACGSYTWPLNGTTYTQSGTYSYSVVNGSGCLDVTELILTVHTLPVVTAADVSGCPGSPIQLIGNPAGGSFSVPNPYLGTSTTYTYTYTDTNGCSVTSASAQIIATPAAPVTGVNMSNIGANTATVNWNQVPGLLWYEVRFRPVGTGSWIGGGTQVAPTTYKNLIGLTAATDYEIEVRGFCAVNSPGSWGTTLVFRTADACPTPQNLQEINVTQTTATLTWSPIPNVSYYQIRYRKLNSAWITGTSTSASKTLVGLTAGSLYEWQVRAICLPSPFSTGAWSALADFNTLAMKDADVVMNTPVDLIHVYPNPVQTTLHIDLTITENQQTHVRIHDMQGRLVREMQAWHLAGLQQMELMVDDLADGVYQVSIWCNDALKQRQQFVKSK